MQGEGLVFGERATLEVLLDDTAFGSVDEALNSADRETLGFVYVFGGSKPFDEVRSGRSYLTSLTADVLRT